MNKRNLLIMVTDVAFYARGTETWYRCRIFCNDAAAGIQPETDVGGWDRTLEGHNHGIKL